MSEEPIPPNMKTTNQHGLKSAPAWEARSPRSRRSSRDGAVAGSKSTESLKPGNLAEGDQFRPDSVAPGEGVLLAEQKMTEDDVPKQSGVVLSPAGNDGVEKETKQDKELQVEDVGEGEGGGEEQGDPPCLEKLEMVSSHSSMTSTKKTSNRYSSGGRESSKDSDNSSDESEDKSEEEGRRKKEKGGERDS